MRILPIAVIVAAIGGAAAAAPIDGDRIDQTMDRSLDEVYQRDLPLDRDPTGEESGDDDAPPDRDHARGSDDAGSLGSGGSADPGDDVNDDGTPRSRHGTPGDPRRREWAERNERDSSSGGGAFGGVAQFLLWALVAVVAILLVVFIVREASGMSGKEDPATATDEGSDDPNRLAAVIERPRDDADELARQGRFADAIHILLLRTLHELASQNLVRVTPAMTSREVLARVPLLGDARTALAGLVTAVELTWFGDDVPGGPDYTRCREQFEVFATAYRRGAAAGARA